MNTKSFVKVYNNIPNKSNVFFTSLITIFLKNCNFTFDRISSLINCNVLIRL